MSYHANMHALIIFNLTHEVIFYQKSTDFCTHEKISTNAKFFNGTS